MQKKKCRNSRGRDMPRPCAYACKDTTKFKCFKFCRVFERFERHANLKYKYGNRHFWCRGYYVDTVGKNAKKIQEYIQNQLQNDLEYDQMTLKEYIDPFTGEPVNQNK